MNRKTSMTETITFRASPVLQRRIDDMAAVHGGNRSKAIQAAILKAGDVSADGVPDDDEVLRLLGEAARAGNVAAMKELRAYHRERDSDSNETPLAVVDELAERRSA